MANNDVYLFTLFYSDFIRYQVENINLRQENAITLGNTFSFLAYNFLWLIINHSNMLIALGSTAVLQYIYKINLIFG